MKLEADLDNIKFSIVEKKDKVCLTIEPWGWSRFYNNDSSAILKARRCAEFVASNPELSQKLLNVRLPKDCEWIIMNGYSPGISYKNAYFYINNGDFCLSMKASFDVFKTDDISILSKIYKALSKADKYSHLYKKVSFGWQIKFSIKD